MYVSSRESYIFMLSGKYQFLRLDNEYKTCLESKINWKKIFNIGCMSHPEKTTSSCDLRNYRFLRLDNEDKSCLELKINWKTVILPHRLYESSRKSYIIMLSRKMLTSETWLRRHKMFRTKKGVNKNLNFYLRLLNSSRKKSYLIMLSEKLSNVET